MAIKTRTTDEQLVIYRQTSSELFILIMFIVSFIGFGSTFLYVSDRNTFVIIVCTLFIGVGLLLIITIPSYYKRMQRDGGAVIFRADKEGLDITTAINRAPVRYNWSEILKIILTEKLIYRYESETSHSYNIIIVYFLPSTHGNYGILEANRKTIGLTPGGHTASSVLYPKNYQEIIENKLRKLSNNSVEVKSYADVLFDYKDKIEMYEP